MIEENAECMSDHEFCEDIDGMKSINTGLIFSGNFMILLSPLSLLSIWIKQCIHEFSSKHFAMSTREPFNC